MRVEAATATAATEHALDRLKSLDWRASPIMRLHIQRHEG